MHAVAAWCTRLPGEGQGYRALRLLTALVVLCFPAACLLIDRSDSLSLLLLGFIGLWVWIRNGFRSGFGRGDWAFVAAFAAFFLVVVLAFVFGHQTDEGFRLLGRYLRLLFVLPVLLALRRYHPPAAAVWTGLGVAALLLGLDAIWESLDAGGFLRPDGDTNVAILFGDLATLTTFMFAAGYIYIDSRLPRLGPWLVAGGVLMGLLASFLSGTRGAWVAMPVLLILFLSCRHLLRPRTVLAGSAALLFLFVVLALLPATHILARIRNSAFDLRSYWALQHVTRSAADAKPRCMDDPAMLQEWLAQGNGVSAPGFTIEVARLDPRDTARVAEFGCHSGYTVELVNPGAGTPWVTLPRYMGKHAADMSTTMLVKGVGNAGFSFDRFSIRQIRDWRRYQPLSLVTHSGDGYSVAFTVKPYARITLLPIESYAGEYSYSILETPVGQRLDMWSAALQLFEQAPLLGVGTGAYQAETGKLVDAGTASYAIAGFDHPHSEYFDALANRGAAGLLALLALLGVPAWLFFRRLESRDPHRMGAALAGLLVTVGFAIFGLTETMFIHSVTIGWYVIMTAVFFVSTEAPEGRDKGKR